MQTEAPLRGLTLIVTRPRAQASRSANALRDAGAAVIEFPVLDIAPIEATLAAFDVARTSGFIFVSANAVAYGVPALRRTGEIAASTEIFAIGRATASALVDAGFKDVVSPQQSIDSEGLLAMPQLQSVAGRHMIIVKGTSEPGGRTILEQTLTARGAVVSVFECYRRAPAVPDTTQRDAFRNALATAPKLACFALSVETLDSFIEICKGMEINPQSKMALLVPHPRVGNAARAHGFDRIATVPMAESALVAALAELKPQLLTHTPLNA
jgi:uroporphyrinogen-III synthase